VSVDSFLELRPARRNGCRVDPYADASSWKDRKEAAALYVVGEALWLLVAHYAIADSE
jgi:hypothetical protein